jgi:hypothetical protein
MLAPIWETKPRGTKLTGFQALSRCSLDDGCGEQAHGHRAEAEGLHGKNGSC